ncbi:methyltransferase [Plantactinospora sp. KBS50]|uniref:methyltransferase n=1 Tax=Plantactinospora sp. KBS50 TaxID=2024580 RepID=UPI0018DFA597|nr:methyltransferase [Plantactinospora sp. KBS50]
MGENHAPGAEDAFALSQLMFPTTAMCISVAARHGLADVLADRALPVDELASLTGTDPTQLGKVLRLLAEDGVFREVRADVFENSPLSHLLRSGYPRSQHFMARLVGSGWLWDAWGRLAEGLATGRPGFEIAYDTSLWRYLSRHPEEGQVFNGAMNDFSEALSDLVAAAYPEFGESEIIADLGGGTGTYLGAVLTLYPGIRRGILVDLEPVIEQARARADLRPLLDQQRLQLTSGDFFENVPADVDTYVVKQVMHSWDDLHVARLLRRCRIVSPRARFVAAEFVRDAKSARFVKNFDLVMSVTMNGNIRSEAQYAALFRSAGYELTRVVPTDTAFSLLEARPLA